MSSNSDMVAVIGAGFVGLCCAISLTERFRNVALIDPGDFRRAASFGNAGQLAVGEVVPLAGPDVLRSLPGWLMDPLGPLTVRWHYFPKALPWFLRFMREGNMERVRRNSQVMAALCDMIEPDFSPLLAAAKAGHLVKRKPYLRAYQDEAQWRAEGYRWALRESGGLKYDILDADELRKAVPRIGRQFTFAVALKERHYISDLPALHRALQALFTARGGQIVRGEVEAFAAGGDAVSAVRLAGGGDIDVAGVVVAAGAWSSRLSARLGDRVPLESERGYHVTLPNAGIDLAQSVSYVSRGLVITPMNDGLRLAGTVEFAGLDAPPNMARADKLVDAARILLPGIDTSNSIPWMGHRPSFPDSLPVIDRSSRYKNAFYAFGHGHMGLSWAATTGRLLSGLMGGQAMDFDMRPFRLGRF